MKINFIFLLWVASSFNCSGRSNDSELLEVRRAIEASNSTYQELLNKRDRAILSRYTDDACLLPPNSPILCGKNALLKFFEAGSPLMTTFTIVEVIGNGNGFVTEISTYQMFDMNKQKVDEGKIMVI